MSKLPSVDDAPRKPQAKPQELKPVKQDSTNPISEGYCSRVIDVRMNTTQSIKFRQIVRLLEDRGETLKDGTPVNNRRRAALFLIEQFAIQTR